jgi:hypothetical protein
VDDLGRTGWRVGGRSADAISRAFLIFPHYKGYIGNKLLSYRFSVSGRHLIPRYKKFGSTPTIEINNYKTKTDSATTKNNWSSWWEEEVGIEMPSTKKHQNTNHLFLLYTRGLSSTYNKSNTRSRTFISLLLFI